jgi:hypothetical protein
MINSIKRAIHGIDTLDAPITPGQEGSASLSLDNLFLYRNPVLLSFLNVNTAYKVALECKSGKMYIVKGVSISNNTRAANGYLTLSLGVTGQGYATQSRTAQAASLGAYANCMDNMSEICLTPGMSLIVFDLTHQAGDLHNISLLYYEVNL